MDEREQELTSRIEELLQEIDLDEDEIRKNPYWPYLILATWAVAPFMAGDRVGWAIGGFWLGVSVTCLVKQYTKNEPYYKRIKAKWARVDSLKGLLEVHRKNNPS